MLYNIIWGGEGRRGIGGLIIIFKAREIRERERVEGIKLNERKTNYPKKGEEN